MQSVEAEISIDSVIKICHKVDLYNECETHEYESLLSFYNSWKGRSNYKGDALSEEQKRLLITSLQKMWPTYLRTFKDKLASTDPSKVITACLELMKWNYLSLYPGEDIKISHKLGVAYYKSGNIDKAKKILQTVADSSFGSDDSESSIYRKNAKKILKEIEEPSTSLSAQEKKEMFDMDEEGVKEKSDMSMDVDGAEGNLKPKVKPEKESKEKSPKHRRKKEFSLEDYIKLMERHDSKEPSENDRKKIKRQLNKEWEPYVGHSLQNATALYSDGKHAEAIDYCNKLLGFGYHYKTHAKYFESNLYRIIGLSQNALGKKEEALEFLEKAKSIRFTQMDKDGRYHKKLQDEIDAIKNPLPSDTNAPDSPTTSTSSTSSSSTTTTTTTTNTPFSDLKRKQNKRNREGREDESTSDESTINQESFKSQKTSSDSNPNARESDGENSNPNDNEPGPMDLEELVFNRKNKGKLAIAFFQEKIRAYNTGCEVREKKWEYASDVGFAAATKANASAAEARKMYNQIDATITQYKSAGDEGFFKTAEYLNKLEGKGKDDMEYRKKLEEGDKNNSSSSSSSMKNGQ